MFSLVPALGLADIQRWFRGSKITPELQSGYGDYFWTTGGAESLSIIAELISSSRDRVINIYLPAYFCGQSLRFLRSPNIKLCFYELDKGLLPDYSSIISACDINPVDVFVHVHYFGKVAGQESSRDLADKLGAVLIEDCAHVISPFALKVWKGDYLIFSPHKHFPLPKVSFVVSRDGHKMIESRKKDGFPFVWFLKQPFKKILFRKSFTKWGLVWTEITENTNPMDINLLVKRTTMSYLWDFENFNFRRKKNTEKLIEKLSEIEGWKPLMDDDHVIAPYILGMICDSEEIAKKRFYALNENFQIVMQWPDLPFEIKDTNLQHQASMLVGRTLFFFTHHKIELDRLLHALDNLIKINDF
jgi:selenocysteine lyase/cysteine desulfurase